MTTLDQQDKGSARPSLFRAILTESADLLVRSVKMTILVAALTLAIILVGWLFSSGLPLRAIMMINGTS
jgi:hypothetical protein